MNKFEHQLSQAAKALRDQHDATLKVPTPPRVSASKTERPFIWWAGIAAALCVGLAMCFAMAISGFTGAAIPIGLYRLGIDPAVASGPLITTINDLVAVLSYYGLAWALLLGI